MTTPRPDPARRARRGASPAATVLALGHAADYLEGAVIGVAFVLFLVLVARERARARRAPVHRLEAGPDAAGVPGDDAPAAERAESRGGEPR